MATTTNYGWTTPDDTALVKDGAAAIRTLGSSVDTTTKNLNPSTTLGDIEYRSSTANTNTRLGIGSTGNVLTVAGGVPTWAAPAAGPTNWTLLNAGGTALTGAAKITVSFTAPKQLFVLMVDASSATARSFFTLRPNDDSGADYSVGGFIIQPSNIATSSFGIGAFSSDTDIDFGTMANAATSVVYATAFFDFCDQTGNKYFSVTAGGTQDVDGAQLFATQGLFEAGATITSIAVLSSVGNFDAGTIYVYGAN
jgi:hypothetical protein